MKISKCMKLENTKYENNDTVKIRKGSNVINGKYEKLII